MNTWLKIQDGCISYFNDAKIVLWAHNFHVSDYPSAGSMGHLSKS